MDTRKKCAYELCQSLFVQYRPFQKYCSDECREHDTFTKYRYKRRKTVEKKCKNCGKVFLTNDGKRKYHSSECQLIANYQKKNPKLKTCPTCKKTFPTTSYIKKYCNESCYLEARRQRNESNKIS